MRKAEIILVMVVILGLILKFLLIPFGGLVTFLSFITLSSYYIYSFFHQNNLKLDNFFLKNIFVRQSEISRLFFLHLGFSITILGILFRLFFYKGSYYVLSLGLLLLMVMQVYLINKRLLTGQFSSGLFRRLSIIGFIGLITFILPSKPLFYFSNRNQPNFVNAVFNAWDHPDSLALDEEADRLKYLDH